MGFIILFLQGRFLLAGRTRISQTRPTQRLAQGLPRRRKTARTQCLLLNRQTSFYWFHLIALQSFFFKQIEGSWQLCMEQVRWCHFCNSICSLHVSVSHFGNSPSISDLVIIVFVAGIHDQ